MDLDLRYRPKTLKQVIGQPQAIQILRGLYKIGIPHKIMFSGPSGCGKTTLGRIVARKLNCDFEADYVEINCADFRGIEVVRDIRRVMGLAPMAGDCRIWFIDEAHKLTGDAQTAMLKMIEEPPSHVYFMLATTDPNKLIRTIQTRVTHIPVVALSEESIREVIIHINTMEGNCYTDSIVLDKIVEIAGGSARQAVKLFESIMGIEDRKAQIHALERQDSKRQAIEIARGLFKFRPNFRDMAKIMRDVEDDPEKIRHLILGYCNAIILSGGKLAPRAAQLIELFRDNFYDSGKSGLYVSVYQACLRGK